MAYSLENTTDLTALGNAIRAKTSGSATMTVAEMATAINGITTGGGSSATLPDNYMTFEKTNDGQGNPVVNIDLYGHIQNTTAQDINNTVYSYVYPVSSLASIKNTIGVYYGDNYDFLNTQMNVSLHDNQINYLPSYFLGQDVSNQYISITLNLANNTQIKHIGANCFTFCGPLNLPSNFFDYVEDIGGYAFRYTTLPMTTLELPSSLTSIGSYAFGNCGGFTTLIIHRDNLSTIQNYAFQNDTALTTVYFIGDRTAGININNKCFNGCSNLTDIYVPWSEGDVASAPWGATGATVHYNYVPTA